MKMLVQRVSEAAVKIDGRIAGEIGLGFLVFLGVEESDTEEISEKMIKKLLGLRLFADSEGKTNLSLASIDGELLVVSQFTLYADCRKGNRPSFIKAGSPVHAEALYEYVLEKCAETVPHVAHGEFGADMKVSLVNDGPFTVMLDSHELF